MRLSRPYSFSSDQTLGNHSPHPWGHGKPSEPPWDAPVAKLWCSKLKEGSISACSGCAEPDIARCNFSMLAALSNARLAGSSGAAAATLLQACNACVECAQPFEQLWWRCERQHSGVLAGERLRVVRQRVTAGRRAQAP
jgi:hypothetical protein